MSKLSEFISEVKQTGLAKQNRYEVVFQPPTAVVGSYNMNIFRLYCESATLPGLTVDTAPIRTYGEVRQMPFDRTFDTVPLSFYVDNNFVVKDFFDQWLYAIINPQTRDVGFYQNYITEIVIFQNTIQDNDTYSVTLHEAYPKAVDAMTLSFASTEFHTLRVSMNYRWWTGTKIATADGNKQLTNAVYNTINGQAPSELSGSYAVARQYFDDYANFTNKVGPSLITQNFGSATPGAGSGIETGITQSLLQ